MEISKLLTIPEGTIAAWALRYQFRARKLADKAATSAQVPAQAVPRKLALVAAPLSEAQRGYVEGMAEQALRLPAIMREMSDRELVACADKLSKLDAVARKALSLEDAKTSVVVNVGLLSGPMRADTLPPARTLPAYEVLSEVTATGITPAAPMLRDARAS